MAQIVKHHSHSIEIDPHTVIFHENVSFLSFHSEPCQVTAFWDCGKCQWRAFQTTGEIIGADVVEWPSHCTTFIALQKHRGSTAERNNGAVHFDIYLCRGYIIIYLG